MNSHQVDDLTRVKELLRHTSEFIAYFELAETKMMEWRNAIEQQASQIQQQAQLLENDLVSIRDLLSQTGIANFHATAEKALSQGEAHLQSLEFHSVNFTEQVQQQQEKLNVLTEKSLEKIDNHSAEVVHNLMTQLAQYDVNLFHRIANESCDYVGRAANDAVNKSNKLLSKFQFRFGLFAVVTSMLTTFISVLYLNGELPWEMHHLAMNERQAGKVLLQAWPKLSHEEKIKIIGSNDNS